MRNETSKDRNLQRGGIPVLVGEYPDMVKSLLKYPKEPVVSRPEMCLLWHVPHRRIVKVTGLIQFVYGREEESASVTSIERSDVRIH
ncbi:hypothetical protein DFP97_10952 [Paenibacillus prosopidis]|uniref:Uncharacterized protein n=1 Tax=Paenibacillus prosopidis TaxID=630520 RepID=A0A368VWX9_9BACL|nr:hypothetical protein DFP97_10952 [Paenibacillus prosopidis]